MNAIQFIQKHGVKRAKECLPAYEKHYCGLEQMFVEDLKRLVESVDMVEERGGLERCKLLHFNSPFKRDNHIKRLKQAIADYEVIGGEHV